jgi:hypothetical protein
MWERKSGERANSLGAGERHSGSDLTKKAESKHPAPHQKT